MRTEIMGVTFDNLTLQQAVEAGAKLVSSPAFSYVVTPNPEIVNLGREEEDYRQILNGASLVLPDGIGVIYAAKILGTPLQERVPGVDFAAGLLRCLEESGDGLFLLGAKPGVAEQAAEKLVESFPRLVISGTHDGYFKEDAPVIAAIRDSGAKVCFVCLGAPKQEKWMAKNGPATGCHLMVGLGGALDVFSGNAKRAPKGWQNMGLEWLYRLLHEPSRFGRMARLPLFLRDAARERKGNA